MRQAYKVLFITRAQEQDGNFTIYREPVYQANAQGVAGPYLRTPFPSGVAAQPYSATGYYGGLSGPPFVTEGPVGSEVALPSQVPHDLDLGPRPRRCVLNVRGRDLVGSSDCMRRCESVPASGAALRRCRGLSLSAGVWG